VYRALANEGYKPEEFERVYAPMGLEIGALPRRKRLPSASLRKLVAVRRNAATAAHKKLKYEAHAFAPFSRRASAEREHMLAAVILSGGASSRMGSPKALVPFQGRPFLETSAGSDFAPGKLACEGLCSARNAEPIAKAVNLKSR